MANKVLVIGLDGGTYSILEPFSREGLIPNLARLMEHGAKGVLRSTVPPISAPAWATFQTGKHPGKHGLFNFFDMADKGFRSNSDFRTTRVVNHASIQSATVYDYLREARVGTISVNIPLTYPTPELDGWLVSCWLAPPGAKDFTWPRSLAAELPEYRVDQNFGEGMYALTPEGQELDSDFLFDDLTDIMHRRADATEILMRTKPWRVCMVCFTETDRLHHYLWRAVNPEYPAYNTPKGRHELERFKNFYRELDRRVGSLMETAGPDTNVIVMSDHGFDAPPRRRFNISRWMRDQGWVVTQAAPAVSTSTVTGESSQLATPPTLANSGAAKLLKRTAGMAWKRLVPPSLRDQVYARLGYIPTPQVVDWSRTRAWSFGVNNNLGAVCINVKNDYFSGCVDPAEVEKLVEEIAAGLRQLTDPHTGKPVVRRVLRREEVYQGPHLERFPHLLVDMDPDYEADRESGYNTFNPLVSPEEAYPNGRGNHRPEGICLAQGPDIQPGTKGEQSLACIMPTVLALAGVAVPDDLDGMVLTEYLSPRISGAVGSQEARGEDQHRFTQPSDDDVLAIQEKLKQLGYM
ncbi:MAG: alkaline phosphatase family protein [Nitrospirota bacterium]|nr:alkaline phosphatase family protein [Nitrospirota bacterium]